jgi:hypothetical protein
MERRKGIITRKPSGGGALTVIFNGFITEKKYLEKKYFLYCGKKKKVYICITFSERKF